MTVSPQHDREPQIWGGIPPRNPNFTGRAELLKLLRARISGSATAVVPTSEVSSHALQGMGGVGKTFLAVEYVYRYRSEYDLVWWIPAHQPALVRSYLADLAPGLGLPPPSISGTDEAARAVLRALNRGEPHKRWLLVFDNAIEPAKLTDLIPGGPGHVLLTTRNYGWRNQVETLEIDVFQRAESVEFLRRRVSITEAEAGRLADALGDLPLALEQAAALKAETGMAVGEYLDLLRERTRELMDQNRPAEYPSSMSAAWRLSVEALAAKLPEAVELLRCLAFFGPDPVPREILRSSLGLSRPALNSIMADPVMLIRTIRELSRFALAKFSEENRTVQVHRLIQALLREQLDAGDRLSLRHDVHALLAHGAPANPDDGLQWSKFAMLVPHLEPVEIIESDDTRIRDFVLDVVRYLYQSGNRQAAQEKVENVLGVWAARPSEDNDRLLLTAQTHRADILRELGDYHLAAETDETALARSREIFGDYHRITLRIARGLGGDLRAIGAFARAEEHDRDTLDRHVRAFGERDVRTLRSVNNLALDCGLIGRYQEARELHMRAYTEQREPASGASKVEVLGSWNGLARAIRQHGEYTIASDLGRDALEYGRQELGAEHPLTLRVARDLAIALRRSGDFETAHEMAEEGHTLCRHLFGPDNPDTLAAAICLANAERCVGHIDRAFGRAEDTLDRYEPVYGVDHPYTLACTGNVALLHRVKGAPQRAQEIDEDCLAGLDRKVGRNHHYSLNVAINLASDLAVLGDVAAAVDLGTDTLARIRSVFDERHPVALGCAANLITDLAAAGETRTAAELSDATFPLYERLLNAHHPDVAAARAGRRLDFDFDPPPI